MLTAIPLLTLPQFIMLQYVKGKAESWPGLSLYDKYNTLAWELISHLWFLLVLVVMTTLCVWIFKRIRNNLENSDKRIKILDGKTIGDFFMPRHRLCGNKKNDFYCVSAHSE